MPGLRRGSWTVATICADKPYPVSPYLIRRRRTGGFPSIQQSLPLDLGQFFQQLLDFLITLNVLADALFPFLGHEHLAGLPPRLCTKYSEPCSSPSAQRQFALPQRRRRTASVPRRKGWRETICASRERRLRSRADKLDRDQEVFFI